jgi:Ca2+-binding EF-hand superfamily protein
VGGVAVLDEDGDGVLTRAELSASMAAMDPHFNDTPQKLDAIFAVADPNDKGYIE